MLIIYAGLGFGILGLMVGMGILYRLSKKEEKRYYKYNGKNWEVK
jgi:hypothetical protein